ncbi:DnaJ domain-containing protein [Planococcus sp. X10-3]|uniref:DnaJ domain-containing protein n=1 Tax=Planococcus sp. X10-3 TaxID=3061240 RepID=UPI003BB0D35E
MGKFIDYYTLLNILPTASEELIKRAYRIQSKEMHPDQGGDARKFILLTEAYNVLSNPAKRRAYDQEYALHQQEQAQSKERSREERRQSEPEDAPRSQKVYPKFSFDYIRYGKVMLGALIGLSILAKAISALDEGSEPEIPVNPIDFPFTASEESSETNPEVETGVELPDEKEASAVEVSEQAIDKSEETEAAEDVIDVEEEVYASSETTTTDSSSLYVRYLDRIYKLEDDFQSYSEVWETGSDAEITQATYNEFEAWDDLLNEIYQSLKMELTETDFVNLRDTQRTWLLERDRVADAAIVDFTGGSWEAPLYTLAQLEETRKRCLWLVMNYMD